MFYVELDSSPARWSRQQRSRTTGDQIANTADFYPSLVQSFTYDGKFYCAPKDFSTLGAGDQHRHVEGRRADRRRLSRQTWDQLETVAKKLTTGGVTGLVFNDTLDRVDAFMRQAGGSMHERRQHRVHRRLPAEPDRACSSCRRWPGRAC